MSMTSGIVCGLNEPLFHFVELGKSAAAVDPVFGLSRNDFTHALIFKVQVDWSIAHGIEAGAFSQLSVVFLDEIFVGPRR